MQYGRDGYFSRHPGLLPGALLLLLLLGLLNGESGFVSSLRGNPEDSPDDQVPTHGYYEALLDLRQPEFSLDTPRPPPGWLPFGDEKSGIVEEVPSYIRWKMRPNLEVTWYGASFRTNREGFRTPEIALEKPPGTYRVLVFGSSNTMGYGVNDDEMYTRHLENWLNEAAAPARRTEVVNLAVSGDSPSRRLLRMQEEAARFDPDWLLCDASPFDSWVETTHVYATLQRNLPIPFPFVKDAIHRAGVSPSDSLQAFRAKFQAEAERMYSDVYAAWSAEARRLGVPLTVLILPRSDSKEKSRRVIRLIKGLCDQNGLAYLDLSAAFDELDEDQIRLSAWDKHPNARGHRAIFDELRDALLRRGGPPGLALSQPPGARWFRWLEFN
jgi:lysophospholipase L1-like esterase